MGLHFQYTYWAWLLLVVLLLIIIYFIHYNWRKKKLSQWGHLSNIKLLLNGFSYKRKLLAQFLLLIVFSLGAFAAMDLRKAISGDGIIRKGVDALIVLDVSKSMLATDVFPNRLQKAKEFIYELMDQSPNERFGLVLFAGDATIQIPITSDKGTLDAFVDDASPEYMPFPGSNLDSAIIRSIEAFDIDESSYNTVLLISDGEEHHNNAIQYAKKARDKGIVINTIGIGTQKGTTLVDDSTGMAKKDMEGNIVVTKLNNSVLEAIAATTRGSYIHLNKTQDTINTIKNIFNSLDEKTSGDKSLMNFAHYYWIFIIPMILLLIIEIFFPLFKRNLHQSLFIFFLILPFFSMAQNKDDDLEEGNRLYHLQQWKESILYFTKAYTSSNSTIAHYNSANAYFRHNDFNKAVKQYNTVANNKNNPASIRSKAYNNVGLTYIQLTQLENAVNAFKKAIILSPSDNDIRDNLQKAITDLKNQKSNNQSVSSTPTIQLPRNNQSSQKMNALQEKEKKSMKKIKHGAQQYERNGEKDW